MEIGIVGIGQSGKSTLFRALAGADATGQKGDIHMAVVKAPDERLDLLTEHFQPQRKVPAEFKVVDFAAAGGGKDSAKGFSKRHLAELRTCDALLICLRAFRDESVPNPEGTVDPARDLETLYFEFAVADLEVAERRIKRIETQLPKSSKEERELLHKERPVLEKLCEVLEKGGQVREAEMTDEARKLIRGYEFLSDKPLVIVVNIDEADIGKPLPELPVRPSTPPAPVIGVCAKIEMELGAMDPEERAPFLEDLGITESSATSVLAAAWKAIDIICFFTVGKDECRAWPVQRGDSAFTAAGKIHSDIARGFIRAEVVGYDDFVKYGDMNGAKEHGRFRLESRDYIVVDGDLMMFRFNV